MLTIRDYYDEKDSGILFSIFIGTIIVASSLLALISGFIGEGIGLTEQQISEHVFLNWFIQGGVYVLLFFVILFYFRGTKLNAVKSNGLNVKFNFVDYIIFIVLAGGMFLTLLTVNYFYSYFLQEIGYVSKSRFLEINSVWAFIAAILIMCVLPAVCEETVFRGAVLSGFSKVFKSVWAIVISALLFMLMHMNIPQFVNAFLCGLVLAVLVKKTGSIIPGIVVHFVNNFIIVLIEFILSFQTNDIESERIVLDGETVLPFLLLTAIGAGLLIAGFMYIRSRFKNKKEPDGGSEDSLLKGYSITNVKAVSKQKTILYALTGIVLAVLMTVLNLVL